MQKERVNLALDAMGGDNSPRALVEAVRDFAKIRKDVHFIFFGDKKILTNVIKKFSLEKKSYTIIHTTEKITGEDKPSDALRRKKDSSMFRAIEYIKDGKKADAIISAGNTGALMAISKVLLRNIDGIDRPAIITPIPTKTAEVAILDLGANVDCSSDILVQFALMGAAFMKAVKNNLQNVRVSLLNIGSESIKGNQVLQETAQKIEESDLNINYTGFIEPDEIFNDKTDVVVTDGFTGNILLKTIEGTAKFFAWGLRSKLFNSFLSKVVLLLIVFNLLRFKKFFDPRKYNGAMFVGLNGIVVKSHGNSDKVSFFYALETAYNLVINNINGKIREEMKLLNK